MNRRSYVPGPYTLIPRRSNAGIGLFTETAIPKNACVIEYVGHVLAPGEEYKSKSKYLFEITRNKTIDGKPKINKAGYINHSHKPNCEAVIYKGRVFIFSLRRIGIGEELSYDYGDVYVKEHCTPCRCAACAAKRKK